MRRKPIMLHKGVYLKWMNNPSEPVICIVLETFEDKSFKVLVLKNNATIVHQFIEDFEKPTQEEITDFWSSGEVQNLNQVDRILKEYSIKVPEIEMVS